MRSKLAILIAGLVLGLILGLGALTGCGGNSGGGDSIHDTQSLVVANKLAQEKTENFHMDSDMDMTMNIKMDELGDLLGMGQLAMPMKVNIAMDSGRESAHGTTDTEIEFMGQTQKVNAEMYCDLKEGVVYTKAKDADGWTRTEQDMNAADMVTKLSELGADVLKEAQFSSDESSYKLTLSAKALGGSIQDLGLLSDFSSSGVEIKDLKLNDGLIVYSFDKETVLIDKVEMQGVEIEATGSMEGYTVGVGIDIDGVYVFGKYDQLSPEDYQIPEAVTKAT